MNKNRGFLFFTHKTANSWVGEEFLEFQLQVKLSWQAELALFPFHPAGHPTSGIVVILLVVRFGRTNHQDLNDFQRKFLER